MEEQNLSWVDRIFQQAFFYRKEAFVGGISFLLAGILLIAVSTRRSSHEDFMKAEKAFAKWEESATDSQLFEAFMQTLEKAPGLKEKYENEIAQKLIGTSRFQKALVYAQPSIGRLEIESKVHADFVKTTFLIEQDKIQEALERAIHLKEQMDQETPVLYAHNLLRIALLQKKLQNDPGELAAWKEFEQATSAQAMLDSYRGKEVSLRQYMAERKEALSQRT